MVANWVCSDSRLALVGRVAIASHVGFNLSKFITIEIKIINGPFLWMISFALFY